MGTDQVTVHPVDDRAGHRAFWTLPYALYRDDPCWVPPLRWQESRRWSPEHNPSLRVRRTSRFVARRNGRVVGRVMVIHDPAFTGRWEPGTGFFGFFESENRQDTATSLLTAVTRTARRWDLTQVLGPVNLSTNDEVGLLVDGFGAPPTILSPYHPPWYRTLLEGAGLTGVRDYHAFPWRPGAALPPAMERAVRLARAAVPPVSVRAVDPAKWASEIRLLHRMYDACFGDLWGFIPLTVEEFAQRAEEFRPFYRPELALFATRAGQTIGFGLALPDVNELLLRVGGHLLPFGWLTLARGLRRIRAARAILLGVVPEHRGGGVAALLAHELSEAGRRIGLERGELSLIQAGNRGMQAVARALGGRPSRTCRLYRMAVGPGE